MRMKKKLLSFLSLTAIAILAFAATQASRRADAQVLWQDATGVAVTWGTMVGAQEASVAADWKVGDLLQITVTAFDTSVDPWPQVGFKSNIEGWPSVGPFDTSIKNQTMPYVAKFYLTADMVEKLKANQFFISGTAATVTKLEYIKDESGTDYTNAIWIGESTYPAEEWWNATAITIDKSSFANAKAGDKVEFHLSAKGSSLALQPFFGGWSGTKIGIGDNPERFTVDGNVVSIILTADEVTSLKSGGMVLQAGDCTIRTIALTPMYAVNVATDIENGTVEVDKATAAEGETVTVTATPAAGYKLCNALARGVTTEVAVEVKNGKFTMPADAVTVSATFAQPEDIAISPESGADIYTALKAATTDAGKIAKNITINLAADGAYTISNTIEVPAALTIAGPATLTEGQKAPTIDASGLANPFIALKGSTVKAKKSDETESTFLWYGNIEVKNVKVSGVAKQFVKTSETARIDRILLENSDVQYAGQVNIFDLGSSFYTDLTIKNSTVWAPTATNHNVYLIKCDGRCENFEKIGDVYPGNVTTSIINSTLYNIARGQKLNNSNGHMKGKTYNVQKMENSILINVGTKAGNEVNGWMFGSNSTSMKMSYANNTYITLSDADEVVNVAGWTDATKGGSDQSGTSLTTNPGITYAKAEAGDFTIGASTAQAKMKTGDPRWLVDYVAPASATVQNIEFAAEPGDISKQLTTKKYEVLNALNDVGNITINLAANGAYTLSAPIEGSSSITVAGPATLADGENAPVIDAEANTGAFVKMGTPIVAANAKGFYEVDNFAIKNVNVKNIKSYVYDDNKNAFAFAEFAVENCVFEFANTKQDIDAPFRFQAGGPVKFILKNNTMYQKGTKNNKYFVKISSGNFPDKAFATFDGPYVWDIEGNTFYQTIAHGDGAKMAFINGGRVGNNFAKTSITIKKNIFIDCAGSESFLKDLFGGKSTDSDRAKFVKIDTDLNTYRTDGNNIDVSKYDKGTILTTDPSFKDAANGDFTLGASTVQAKYEAGDPRWKVAFTGGYTITMGTVTNGTVEAGGTSPYAAGEKVRLTLTPAEGYAIDNKPTFKNDEDVDVTELVTVGQDADGFYLVMPAFNITASYAFSKLYTITLPTETTHGTITIVKPEGTNKSVAGKQIKIKVTDLTDGYKVVAKNGDTDITLNEGDHATYDYFFEMPEGDVTISIVDATGINAISVDGAADIFADGKPVYNLAGQRVFKGYKGLVIKNGKKVVVK